MAGLRKYGCLLLVLCMMYNDAHGSKCKAQSLLKLQKGKTYVYNFEGKTETTYPRKSPVPEIKIITARVQVTPKRDCTTLIKPLGLREDITALGETHCDSWENPKEDLPSVEFIRSAFNYSFLQISIDHTSHVYDAYQNHGSCLTRYLVVHLSDETTNVAKMGNMNQCFRNGTLSFWPDTWTVANVTSEIEIRLKNGVIQAANSKQGHELRDNYGFIREQFHLDTKITLNLGDSHGYYS